ncbi:hypothetical protein [Rhizobium rhizogenes]|uniref:hypothetical protein n=1 Tax=Rhizobium rhizogenes TaxID=359 RepID=UPI0022C48524|nr:hypothetical protein [Rhizobium rhizogenes]MCZ7480919.1 hypothetical protein [Rhizobium rhizogenes]
MEVRLSDFAEIVGTTTAVIRNAIQLNKLPFLDVNRKDHETTQKTTRRTYSVEDAFAWFLHEEAGRLLNMGQWAIAGRIQANWPRGLSLYAKDRVAGKAAENVCLILSSSLPGRDGTWSMHDFVILRNNPANGEDNALQIINKYPLVTVIHLDPLFERFRVALLSKRWTFTEDGFQRLTSEAE